MLASCRKLSARSAHRLLGLILFYSNFMRTQAMSSRMLYNRPLPVNRIVNAIADSELQGALVLGVGADLLRFTEAQVNTQHYGRRPYGVGFLVAGYDVRQGL